MFETLKAMFKKDTSNDFEYNSKAIELTDEIKNLEDELKKNNRNSEVQKKLMLTYNRALKIYSKSSNFRNQIDPLFLKIDDLRNTIRKNI